ncbi:hypothetical protein ACIRQP_37240 [Streptomyces sp. NPDC102274]|uniref:hypothetical protein n=1 Tax=Streptomyces sp. NPDC102274 TaxID=3366151 RepID=UPI00381593A2
MAVVNSPQPTHAVHADRGFEQAVRSPLRHRAYIEALTDGDAETYVHRFLTRAPMGTARGSAENRL